MAAITKRETRLKLQFVANTAHSIQHRQSGFLLGHSSGRRRDNPRGVDPAATYRGHEEDLAETYQLEGVQPAGLRAAWQWIKSLFGGEVKFAPAGTGGDARSPDLRLGRVLSTMPRNHASPIAFVPRGPAGCPGSWIADLRNQPAASPTNKN